VKDFLLKKNQEESWDVFFCLKCKVGITIPFLNSESLVRYYPVEYEAFVSRIGLKLVLQKIKSISDIRFLKRRIGTGKIYEIGAGRGEFLAELLQAGFDCSGSEISHYGRRFARSSFGLNLENKDENSLFDTDEKYDIVLMKHVLEHTSDPLKLLCLIKQKALTQNGLLFIKIPNLASLESKLCGEYWHGLDVPRHLWHFTPIGITQILEKAGFKEIVVQQEVVYADILRSIGNSLSRFGWYRTFFMNKTSDFLLIPFSQLVAFSLFLASRNAGRLKITARI
jgi:predicted SAM-dependent methyltransferase